MNPLQNKKVLFISTIYFDYYKDIKQSLEKNGAVVSLFLDDWFEKNKLTFLLKGPVRKLKKRFNKGIARKLLSEISDNNFDYVFVIRGECIDEDFLIKARQISPPSTKWIMYQWDSVKNYNYAPLIPYFDRVLSFDPSDCARLGLEYAHLFAVDRVYSTPKVNSGTKYDVLLMGYNHSIRHEFATQLIQYCQKHQLPYFIKLYEPKLSVFIKYLKNKSFVPLLKFIIGNDKIITSSKIDRNRWYEMLHNSKYVIDLAHPHQVGMTMRTFETLASQSHLITTNSYIKQEDFYTPESITVISDFSSLEQSNILLSDTKKHIASYQVSIDYWLSRIFFS